MQHIHATPKITGMAALRSFVASALDLVFPRVCAACDTILVDGDADWCRDCSTALLAATATEYCPRCGVDARPYLLDDAGCNHCRSQPTPLAGMARVATYDSIVGQVARRFKYHRRQQMDRALGTLLAAAIAGRPWTNEIDALVPVPTTRRKQWHYRFRPPELLAGVVGRALNLPVLPIVGVKGKKLDQVGLSTTQRIENVHGVFRVSRHARLEGKALCLIDDVSTSGATLRELGRSLKKAGAERIYAAVLAKTEPREFDTRQA